MKRRINNLFLLLALIAALGLISAGQVTAQTFTTLHSFAKIDLHTGDNSDGDNPNAGLIVSGNTLYGTAWDGGTSDAGTVFKVNTDGTGFKTLSSLTPVTEPNAPLVLSSDTLYGTAREGFGSFGNGTVFRVKTDGTGFAILHNFAGGNGGANPLAALVLSGTTLYGTTSDLYLDAPYSGTVFKINTDGTGFTTLHSFIGTGYGSGPAAGLVIISGNTLYGTTTGGGGFGMGSVFAVNTDGTGFTNLYSFTGGSDGGGPGDGGEPGPDGGDGDGLILSGNTLYGVTTLGSGTVFAVNTDGTGFTTLYSFTGGSDGAGPSGLILSDNTLYGTSGGGTLGSGTVFAVNTDGTGFTNLHTFTALSNSTNSDGANPYGLILAGNTLCGFSGGGSLGNGTVFKVNTDGTGFTTLYSFTAPSGPYPETNSDGADLGGLILSGNTLYGTASGGGRSGSGTVFSLTLPQPPPLTIIPLEANVILTWPTNATGFALQSTTNLLSPAVWTSVSTQAVVVNGQNTVTNPITGTQQFYRLSQ